jgi:UDP-N-acetyl-D-glucosamine/UDP-N-acetyl-D-galactosamine dehydrogenase
MDLNKLKISVIGLGYVGLPLATALSKNFKVLGFDKSKKKVNELINGKDPTNQLSTKVISNKNIRYSNNPKFIKDTKVIIVTVPTPVDKKNNPDISLVKNACKIIGLNLSINSIVVFESTVYPGLTEEVCVKELEKYSKLKWKKDFHIGYSPERINPGDKIHNLQNIIKVISADDKKTQNILKKIYKKIIKKIYLAPSIKVAEAAKIIENTQRDINIAFMNELSIIFSRLNINIYDVLQAAGTKWNFLKFEPGLVGGHCIGVDPYYLTYKAKKIGYSPKIILSGRNLNDNMTKYLYLKYIKLLKEKLNKQKKINVLLLGITFKENCNDFRNSKPVEFYKLLSNSKNINIDVHDPCVNKREIKNEYNIKVIEKPLVKKYDSVVLLVKHNEYKKLKYSSLKKYCKEVFFVFDIKNLFNKKFKKKNIITI